MLSKSGSIVEEALDPKRAEGESDLRFQLLLEWLDAACSEKIHAVTPASGDASFRRYFRVHLAGRSFIAMDAPPAVESIRKFVQVSNLFSRAGVQVPEIFDSNEAEGFMLLGDLGSISYLSCLDPQRAASLYHDAIEVLFLFKRHLDATACGLPEYDIALLRRELDLFEEWFLTKKLGLKLSDNEIKMLEKVKQFLIDAIQGQPKVVVHRDFHSRNLMVTDERNPGVLDFQDAVVGPLGYDLVSLLRDCYIAWPEQEVRNWAMDYFSGLGLKGVDFEQFYRWFDLCGVQRHLKVAGIFSRLEIRDHKPGYLKDIPRTLNYIRGVAHNYPEMAWLQEFLSSRVAEKTEGLFPA